MLVLLVQEPHFQSHLFSLFSKHCGWMRSFFSSLLGRKTPPDSQDFLWSNIPHTFCLMSDKFTTASQLSLIVRNKEVTHEKRFGPVTGTQWACLKHLCTLIPLCEPRMNLLRSRSRSPDLLHAQNFLWLKQTNEQANSSWLHLFLVSYHGATFWI